MTEAHSIQHVQSLDGSDEGWRAAQELFAAMARELEHIQQLAPGQQGRAATYALAIRSMLKRLTILQSIASAEELDVRDVRNRGRLEVIKSAALARVAPLPKTIRRRRRL